MSRGSARSQVSGPKNLMKRRAMVLNKEALGTSESQLSHAAVLSLAGRMKEGTQRKAPGRLLMWASPQGFISRASDLSA